MELEVEMCEAEKWEGDVQQLFDGLESSDKILSARLEHDLTAEDLPNDTQVGCMLLNVRFDFNIIISPFFPNYL